MDGSEDITWTHKFGGHIAQDSYQYKLIIKKMNPSFPQKKTYHC